MKFHVTAGVRKPLAFRVLLAITLVSSIPAATVMGKMDNICTMGAVHTETIIDSAALRPFTASEQQQRHAQNTRFIGWTLSDVNGSIVVPASVPGAVHLVRRIIITARHTRGAVLLSTTIAAPEDENLVVFRTRRLGLNSPPKRPSGGKSYTCL